MVRMLKAPVWLRDQTQQQEKIWDFTQRPERLTASVVVTAGANANDDVAKTYFWLTGTKAALITDAYCAVSANSTGVDANNTSAWAIVNGASTTLVTKTFNAAIVAGTSYNMGAIATGYVSANSAVSLTITNGTTADLNSAVCVATIGYIPADSFLDGLKVIATDGGAVAVADGVNGILSLTPSDSTAGDNDEIYLCTDTELFKLASGSTFEAECSMKYAEASTDDANVFFGFMSTVAADSLVDNGAGPQATGDYIGFWKVDGGTQWYVGVQSNGTATPTADTLGSPLTTAGSTTYKKLHIKVVCKSSTYAQATFSVDGVVIGDIHFAYASATEMALAVGLKNGTTTAETLYLEYLGYANARVA